VLFLHSLIQVAKERHNAEVRRQRLAAAAPPRVRALRRLQRAHHQRAPSLSLRNIALEKAHAACIEGGALQPISLFLVLMDLWLSRCPVSNSCQPLHLQCDFCKQAVAA